MGEGYFYVGTAEKERGKCPVGEENTREEVQCVVYLKVPQSHVCLNLKNYSLNFRQAKDFYMGPILTL